MDFALRFVVAVVVSIFVGFTLGFFIACAMAVGSNSDEAAEREMERRTNDSKSKDTGNYNGGDCRTGGSVNLAI